MKTDIETAAVSEHEKPLKRIVIDDQQPEVDLTENLEKQEELIEAGQGQQNDMMTGESIRKWRPQNFSDFAGARIRRRIGRLQRRLLAGILLSPLLLVGERNSRRLQSQWFGSGARLKAQAWSMALEMTGIN